MPLQTVLVTPAQQRINRAAGADGSGAQQLATYFVGQVVGSLDRIRPVRQVMREMVAEYAETVGQLIDQIDG